MTWFKVDDNLAFHSKTVQAGNAAMGLWVRAGSWSAQQLTDGFVPDHIIAALGTPRQATSLVEAGLWEKGEGGCQFHQWNEEGRQPTRAEVEAKRAEAAERMRRNRKQRRAEAEQSERDNVDPTTLDEQFPEDAQVSDERSREHDANTSRTSRAVRAPRPDPTRPGEKKDSRAARSVSDPAFDAFWASYPRKVGKPSAVKAWAKAIKGGANPDDVMAGLRRYVFSDDAKFIPHPSSWLNDERWAAENGGRPRLRAVSGGDPWDPVAPKRQQGGLESWER